LRFILDRMLGKMRIWLRLCGYDTLYVGEMDIDMEEDDYLLLNYGDRILVTRDRELFRKSMRKKRNAIYIESNDIESQMVELKRKTGLSFRPVMERCSLCNSLLRRPEKEEAIRVIEREKFPEDILNQDLFYCEKCDKLYWAGSHWDKISNFLSKLNSR